VQKLWLQNIQIEINLESVHVYRFCHTYNADHQYQTKQVLMYNMPALRIWNTSKQCSAVADTSCDARHHQKYC